MRGVMVGMVVGLASIRLVRLLRQIRDEALDHRASFTYVAEMVFARQEHERKWVEARNPRVGNTRYLFRSTRLNHFFVDWAGE